MVECTFILGTAFQIQITFMHPRTAVSIVPVAVMSVQKIVNTCEEIRPVCTVQNALCSLITAKNLCIVKAHHETNAAVISLFGRGIQKRKRFQLFVHPPFFDFVLYL